MCIYSEESRGAAGKRHSYSRTYLIHLKPCPAVTLAESTIDILHELGILKSRRGRRGGRHVRRQIPVIVSTLSRDSTLYHQLQHTQMYNLVPLQRMEEKTICPSQKPPLLPRMLLTNARSLNNKIEEFELVLLSNKVDIAVVTETWFTEASVQQADITGFTTFSKIRPDRRGGGVAVFAKDHLSAHTLPDHTCEFECMWMKLSPPRINGLAVNLYIGAIYYPPNSNHEQEILEHMCSTIDNIQASDSSAVITIVGDFNNLKCDCIE